MSLPTSPLPLNKRIDALAAELGNLRADRTKRKAARDRALAQRAAFAESRTDAEELAASAAAGAITHADALALLITRLAHKERQSRTAADAIADSYQLREPLFTPEGLP